MNTPPLDVTDMAGRLAWALLLGSAVGFERQWHQKMAGLKTNALVALGAAGFVCFGSVAGNPSQVGGQIVSGIGFLGAGVIMREGISVHGLNTAATLWCSAMVGSLAGFGLWQPAGVAASLVLGANLALRPVANRLNSRVQAGNEIASQYTFAVQCELAAVASVRAAAAAAMRAHRLRAQQVETGPGPVEGQVSITARMDSNHVVDDAVEKIVAEVAAVPGVVSSSWQVTRAMPEA